ncbi:MAG: TetR family transcriptional regulator [Muricauda sp.]|nr:MULTISPECIES: helix-turn-helix domain-containing protein [unclassified Allomuricauda]MAU14517.1 TetR family transcriptional regulator [Allomuricauda sp.]|tara:strand:+ start:34 stop:597 length:564 start_codon:yes stop_codon:yes gene_type:complete
MPRVKEYNEAEVLESAMHVFWKNGYKNTSLRMLSKEMGINQFSINASFGNKQNLFLESLKLYRNKLHNLLKSFEDKPSGIENIKSFFYGFVAFSNQDENKKGCLIVNTISEFGLDLDQQTGRLISSYGDRLKAFFKKNLEADTTKDNSTIKREVNYLYLAIGGLAMATKVYDEDTIKDYIETIFKNV